MSVYDMVSISLMSAPAAKTFSPPQTMTAATSLALGGLAARGDQAVLDLGVEGVHRGPVEADRADAALDLEADEVAHDGASRPVRRPRRSGRARAPAGARCARRTGSPGSRPAAGVDVGAGGDEVLADDDEGRAGDAGLDAVHVEVELVARLVQRAAGRRGASSWICHWPKTRMISTSPSEQRTKSCWLVDGERDVAVVVEVRARGRGRRARRGPGRAAGARPAGAGSWAATWDRSWVQPNHSLGSPPCRRPPRPAPAPGPLGRDLPPPPGVTLVEGGADVAVYAGHADGVDVCLFDAGRRGRHLRAARAARRAGPRLVVRLRARACGPGQRYDVRVARRVEPRHRAAAQPRQAAARPVRPGARGRGHAGGPRSTATSSTTSWHGDGELRSDLDSRGYVPRCVVVDDALRLGGRRARRTGPRSETRHLRGARAQPDRAAPRRARGAARHLRRAGAPRRRWPTSPSSASPPSSCCPCTPSPPSRTWCGAG